MYAQRKMAQRIACKMDSFVINETILRQQDTHVHILRALSIDPCADVGRATRRGGGNHATWTQRHLPTDASVGLHLALRSIDNKRVLQPLMVRMHPFIPSNTKTVLLTT